MFHDSENAKCMRLFISLFVVLLIIIISICLECLVALNLFGLEFNSILSY